MFKISISVPLTDPTIGPVLMKTKLLTLNLQPSPDSPSIASFDTLTKTCLLILNNRTCYFFPLKGETCKKIERSYTSADEIYLNGLLQEAYEDILINKTTPNSRPLQALEEKPLSNYWEHIWKSLSCNPTEGQLCFYSWKTGLINPPTPQIISYGIPPYGQLPSYRDLFSEASSTTS